MDEFHQDEKNDKFLEDLESPDKASKSSASKKVHSSSSLLSLQVLEGP